jgi:hypothetical protein
MAAFISLSAVVEGDIDAAVAERLARATKVDLVAVHTSRGKNQLDARLNGYNRAARHGNWLVLRDLDRDAKCAPELVRELLPEPSRGMHLRIAVRSIEAWVLADVERASRFLGISQSLVPQAPDALADPKRTLVTLASRSSRRTIREDLVPARGMSAKVGPVYTSRLVDFITSSWRPGSAATRSPSLASCLRDLRRLKSDSGVR